MKKSFLLGLFLLSVPFVSYSQSIFSNSLGGGLDYNYNVYYDYNNNQKFQVNQDFNFDVNGAFQLGNKLRLRLEVDYSNFSYGQRYYFEKPSDNTVVKSEITIHNLSLTPRVDYKLVVVNKFDVFVSSGFKFEMNLGSDEESQTSGGKVYSSSHISTDYDHFMQGIAGGLLLKYNLSKHLSVNLAPDYSFYLQKFYDQSEGNLQRISVNLGIEWRY